MRTLLRILRDGIGLMLTMVIGALVFLLFTESGAQLVLREVETRTGLIQTEGVGGRLWGPLRLQRLRYEDAFVRVELEQAELDWSPLQLLRASVALSQLHATALRVHIKDAPPDVSGDKDADGALTRLPVNLDVRKLRVDLLEVHRADSAPLALREVALSGAWRNAQLSITELAAITPWVGPLRLTGAATLHADAIDIERLALAGFADASLEGRYAYAGASDLRLAWSALRWPPESMVGSTVGSTAGGTAGGAAEDTPEFGSDSGTLHWQGSLDDWRYDLVASIAVAGEHLQVDADGHGSMQQVVAESLRVDSGHGSIAATATLQFDGLALTTRGRVEGLQPQHWLADLEGLIQGDFEVQAALAADAPEIDFSVKLDRSTLQGYAADVDVQGSYAAGSLQLARFDLRSGPNRVRGSGQVWPELALEARLDARDLSALLPELAGSARGRVRLSGPMKLPHAVGMLDAAGLRYQAYAVEALDASFDLDPAGELHLDARLRDVAAGTPIQSLSIGLRGRLQAHRLALDAVLPQARAEIGLEGALDADRAGWSGTLASARLTPVSFPTFELEQAAALRLRGDAVELEPACFIADVARLCAGLRPVDGGRRIAFRLRDFDLAAVEPWLPNALQAEGRIDGHGYVDFGHAGLLDLRLDLDSSPLRLTRSGLPTLVVQPGFVRVTEEDRVLHVNAALPFERGGLQLVAQLDAHEQFLQRSLHGELRADLPDLSWLQLFSYELRDVAGRLEGSIAIAGSLAAPRFDGRIELADAGLRLRRPGIRLERVRATLIGSSEGVLNLDAEAWSDDGPLRIDGHLNPWTQPLALEMRVRGERFQAVRTPDAAVWITPELEVKLASGELRVSGVVDVPRADITPKSADSGVGATPDQVIVRRGDAFAEEDVIGIFADVQVRLGEAVRFEGFGLKSQLRGGVRVIEAPGVPTRARGELQLVEGRYKAYGQDLTIETGKLLFTGGVLTDPAVELRATRQPRADITVGVLVRGTLDKPEFSLFSTPAMPQERQLSWLVLGRSLDDDSGSASDRDLVAGAALGLGLAGGEWLAQRVGGRIGFDEITLGAKPGESSDLARLTVGKYLSPRLFISYGVGLFQPGHSFRLQYDIGRGFKLATETGVESGGDLLYTIER